ncbi:unnamed protein product, partial [Brassica rapa]
KNPFSLPLWKQNDQIRMYLLPQYGQRNKRKNLGNKRLALILKHPNRLVDYQLQLKFDLFKLVAKNETEAAIRYLLDPYESTTLMLFLSVIGPQISENLTYKKAFLKEF